MSNSQKGGETVKVIIRCRPINKKELQDGHKTCVEMDTKRGVVAVIGGKNDENTKRFTFDAVYGSNSKQKEMYDETFRELVQSVLEGFNGTIFAYGQTGTGKTHTMQGLKDDPIEAGVIPRSFEHIFSHISRSSAEAQYLVRSSYLEIYKEDVRDLLHRDQNRRLEIKENPETGIYVKDLSSVLANSCKELDNVMHIGNQNRSVGATNMNEHSSRSHAIFIVTVECSKMDENNENHIRVGKLNMVDLAGSERQSKTHSEGERLKEATKINLSLSALGNVISALVDGKSTHIPYRDSKLTRLLQDSLGGNSKTVMIANIGPASYNFDETVNTLRYANRAKNIKNRPRINEDPKDALLREYQEKIERMKQLLEQKGGSATGKKKPSSGKKKRKRRLNADGSLAEEGSGSEDDDDDDEEINARAYHEQKMSELDVEKQAILGDKNMLQSQKTELLEKLARQEESLNEELSNKQELENQIQAMESKVLRGDKDIVQHTREQEVALETRRQEIYEHQKRQRQIEQRLEQQNDALIKLADEHTSLNQRAEEYTEKRKKLKEMMRSTRMEQQELQDEQRLERDRLMEEQERLTQQLKLKELILDNFVATEDRLKLAARLALLVEPGNSGSSPEWGFTPLASGDDTGSSQRQLQPRPHSAVGGRRPECLYSRRADCSPRHRAENVIVLDLDQPSRTTHDYKPPSMAPQLAAALETALRDEGDIELDGRTVDSMFDRESSSLKNSASRRRERRPKTDNSKPSPMESQFPTSRGLVPKNMK